MKKNKNKKEEKIKEEREASLEEKEDVEEPTIIRESISDIEDDKDTEEPTIIREGIEDIANDEDTEEPTIIRENIEDVEESGKNKKSGKKKKTSKKSLLIVSAIILAVLLIAGVGLYFTFPRVNLTGSHKVVLNYKEKYKEAGYKAYLGGKDITKDVKIKGRVNSEKLGVYEITYEVGKVIKRKVVRTVEVKDTSKPVLQILDDKKEVHLCPGHKFSGIEVSAKDNYDGDLTKKIKLEEKKDKVIYTVKDSSGNKTSATIKLVYEDDQAPVITLNGGNIGYAFLNEEFNDPGYSVSDNCDGDITSKVVVDKSKLDLTKGGKYDVTYSITDLGGNKATATRSVIVSERGANGVVYLTFDDGPQSGTTDVILDILKEEGVEATFFVTNKGPDELIKRMYDEGHTVALHTASHDYATVYSSVEGYYNDLNLVNERVKRITGSYSYIIRFPGGASNTVSRRYCPGIMSTLTQDVLTKGYRYFDWNVSSGDAGSTTDPAQVRDNVIYSLRRDRANVVLMHDIKPYTRDALREIIRYGKENGYSFQKITMNTQMVTQRVNN